MSPSARAALRALSVILAAGAAVIATPSLAAGATVGSSARVTKVVDGDTVQVRERGRLRTITLAGADAPEGFACGADAARTALAGLLPRGAKVRLRRDRAASSSDRYVFRGRRLVNAALVRAGHAVVGGSAKLSRRAELRAAERDARAKRRGLWASCPAPAPSPGPAPAPGTRITGAEAVQRARADLSDVLFTRLTSQGSTLIETRLHLCRDGYAVLDTASSSSTIDTGLLSRIEGTWEVLAAEYQGTTTATASVRLSSAAGAVTSAFALANGRFTIDGAEVTEVGRSDICAVRAGGA